MSKLRTQSSQSSAGQVLSVIYQNKNTGRTNRIYDSFIHFDCGFPLLRFSRLCSSALLCLSLVILWNQQVLGNDAFYVEGTLSCTYYKHSLTNVTQVIQKTGFEVWVKDNLWTIKTTFGSNWYSLHGCDGTNVYSLLYDPSSTADSLPGQITPGICPLDSDYYTFMPWLIYASGAYIEKSDSVSAFWMRPRSEVLAWAYDSKINRSPAKPFLPIKIRYVASSNSINSAPSNEVLRIEAIPERELKLKQAGLRELISVGSIGGELEVVSTTNLNGLEIPTKFTAMTYNLKQKNTTNMLFEGKIGKVAISERDSYLPKISEKVSAADYRFRDVKSKTDHILYFIADSQWPAVSDPKLVKEFNQKRSRIPSFEQTTLAKIVLYLIFALLLFAPVYFLTRRNANTENKT